MSMMHYNKFLLFFLIFFSLKVYAIDDYKFVIPKKNENIIFDIFENNKKINDFELTNINIIKNKVIIDYTKNGNIKIAFVLTKYNNNIKSYAKSKNYNIDILVNNKKFYIKKKYNTTINIITDIIKQNDVKSPWFEK